MGPQSYRRTRLFLSGSLHVFTIGFQPGGFHALFGTPMTALVDQGAVAGDVIGEGAATALRDAVGLAGGFEERVARAERWVDERIATARADDPVARAAMLLQRSGGRLRIDRLTGRTGLGERQFTRRFETQVGLTPKLFARTVRLNAVLDAKARAPDRSWTDLAHAAGYADQSHLVRDCRALAGDKPGAFFPDWVEGR